MHYILYVYAYSQNKKTSVLFFTSIPDNGIILMAIRSFKNQGTEDIHYGRVTKHALQILPHELHRKARVKLARLSAASNLHDLRSLPGNRFEPLKGDRKGQYSIRINDQYRICFKWEQEETAAVEILDYH